MVAEAAAAAAVVVVVEEEAQAVAVDDGFPPQWPLYDHRRSELGALLLRLELPPVMDLSLFRDWPWAEISCCCCCLALPPVVDLSLFRGWPWAATS